MENRMQGKIDSIGFINESFLNITPVVCAIMVIGLHSYNINNIAGGGIALIEGFFSHGLFTAAVPMFLFLSGYLFYRNITGYRDTFNKQKKRVKTVLLPFLAWSAFYTALYIAKVIILHQNDVLSKIRFSSILIDILFYRHAFLLWFMFQLCIYILLAPLIFFLTKHIKLGYVVLLLFGCMGLLEIELKVTIGGEVTSLFQSNYFFYYLLGCLFSKSPTLCRKISTMIKRIPVACLVLFYISLGVLSSFIFDKRILLWNNRCLIPLVFFAFFALMLRLFSGENRIGKLKISPIILYGIHPCIQMVVSKILTYIPVHYLINYAMVFCLTAAFSYIAGCAMKRIKPLYYIFSGNR